MNAMTVSAYSDKTVRPSPADMLTTVGSGARHWRALVTFMDTTYGIAGEPRHYGKSYGWMLWFHRGKKTLLCLYPQDGGLVAQITLGPTLVDAALALPLCEKMRAALEEAHPYPEGRWLFVTIAGDDEARDVERLVLLKQPRPRRATPRTEAV